MATGLRLSTEGAETQAAYIAENTQRMAEAQTTIFTMIGGGMLGNSAVTQPGDFYIDSRVGRLPFSKREILQAASILARAARLRNEVGPGGTIPDYRQVHLNLGIDW